MRRPRPFRGVPDTKKEMKVEGCEDERCCGRARDGESSGGSRPEGAAERANEDWSWMVGEDPTFYLQESDRSRERE